MHPYAALSKQQAGRMLQYVDEDPFEFPTVPCCAGKARTFEDAMYLIQVELDYIAVLKRIGNLQDTTTDGAGGTDARGDGD